MLPLANSRLWPTAGIYDRQLYGRSDDKRRATESPWGCVDQHVALCAYESVIGRFRCTAFIQQITRGCVSSSVQSGSRRRRAVTVDFGGWPN
jgi:hypothetical protein